jgi:hypothetical protein
MKFMDFQELRIKVFEFFTLRLWSFITQYLRKHNQIYIIRYLQK